MKQFSLSRAIIAGFFATAVMTMMMVMAPLMGMPEMNIGRMLAGFMGMPVALGWGAHFMIGIVLAVTYTVAFAGRLPGSSLVKGLLFGLMPWLMAQVVVNPMMGAGLFASDTPAPAAMVMGSLMGHMVYGAVLGVVYGRHVPRSVAAATQH
ncbi:MAG: DUF2938 family protein [Ignavibacteriae bacterium]|nr:DUF2938 family protein [Ignavibacteriota bacterium]